MRTFRKLAAATALLIAGCAGVPRAPTTAASEDAGCLPATIASSTRFRVQPIDTGLPDTGQWRDGFALADMDGDGHLDVLHGPARKGRSRPVIFRGNGNGRFTEWKEAHFPPLPYDYGDIQAADFNRDGRLDIALSAHLRGLAVLINESGGHYAPWGEGLTMRAPGEFPNEAMFSSRSIAAVDWNRDGQPDLLALNEGPSRFATAAGTSEALALFLNRSGYWQRMAVADALHSLGDALATGDVDGDRRPDAVIGTQVEGNRRLLQLGDANGYRALELKSLPPRAAATAVALHDIDRDGRDEILLGTRAVADGGFCSALQVVARDADGSERTRTLWRETSTDTLAALAMADLDGDGHDDLIALRQRGGITFYAGGPSGFTRDLHIAAPAAMHECQAYDSGVADLDGDGRYELIASYAGDAAGVLTFPCPSAGGFAGWRIEPAGAVDTAAQ